MPYEVQTYTLCQGWVNTWLCEDDSGKMVPEIFLTSEAAQAALDEHFQDLSEEIAAGNIADYDRSEFRIAQTQSAATVNSNKNCLEAWDYDPYDDHFSFYSENDRRDDYLFRVEIPHDVPEHTRLKIIHTIAAAPDMRKALHIIDESIQSLLDSEHAGITSDTGKDLEMLQVMIAENGCKRR